MTPGKRGADGGGRGDAPAPEGPGGGRSPGEREARLDELREEAARSGRVSAEGAAVRGGPIPGAADGPPRPADGPGRGRGGEDGGPAAPPDGGEARPGYYGMPVVKPPVWTWEVPAYFFVGGLAGMAAVLAAAAELTGSTAGLVAAALALAAGGSLASAVLLILDLGRPRRFLNMLRVFKWRSPMSVGAWILTLFGAASVPAAGLAAWRTAAPAAPGWVEAGVVVLALPAAAAGAVLATYTGVLLGATVVPAWIVHRAALPVHFGLAGLGSAAAALELLGFRVPALHHLGLAVAAAETVVAAMLELRRYGPADRAVRTGRAGLLLRTAGALSGPGALALRLAGWIPAAAAAFLAGALVSRFGWVEAGRASARDPEATFALQGGAAVAPGGGRPEARPGGAGRSAAGGGA